MQDSLTIRKANRSDLPDIIQLVRELAVYEKAPEEVWVTLEDYEDGFESVFDALVAEWNGRIVGIALYYLTFSTWKGKMLHLEDFIVTESHRGKGIGKQLFDEVISQAQRLNTKLMRWQVLDWNEPAIAFYNKYDVAFDTDWWNVKMLFTGPPAQS